MSSIIVEQIGQLGNQLFGYCIGKILANKTGLSYRPPSCFLTKSGTPIVWNLEPIFEMKTSEGMEPPDVNPINLHCYQWLDLGRFHGATSIRLTDGYYQHYELYRSYKDQIRTDWLRPRVPFIETDPDAVYCQIRRTDYVGVKDTRVTGAAITIEELVSCLYHFPKAKRLIVCTDDVSDPWFDSMRSSVSLPILSTNGTWDEDFQTLMSADNLLISQSTYGWWAGFLGKARKIVCPIFPRTFWWYGHQSGSPPRFEDSANLVVTDEPERWVWVTE